MTFLGDTLFKAQQLLISLPETRFEKCIRILIELKEEESILEADNFHVSEEFLKLENYCSLFYIMTLDMRLTWLKQKDFLN